METDIGSPAESSTSDAPLFPEDRSLRNPSGADGSLRGIPEGLAGDMGDA
jgi:hypothetical protein